MWREGEGWEGMALSEMGWGSCDGNGNGGILVGLDAHKLVGFLSGSSPKVP